MNAAIQPTDENTLHVLTPLCDLSESQRRVILAHSETYSVRRNDTIFEIGETDERSIYILSGEIALISADGTMETIRATTPRALQPISQKSPHEHAAVAITNCTLLSINRPELSELLKLSPAQNESADTETLSNNNWLKDLLQGPAYGSLLPQQIDSLLTRVEAVPVKAGQVIIKQGSAANNFYIIRSGRFQITRKIDGAEHPIELAILSSGSGFGEDALITNGRRNAYVTAIEEGELLRLSKHNFTTLLAKSLIKKITLEEAERLVKRGAAFIDVRASDEYKRNGLSEAIHVPLSLLRANLNALKPGRDYIAYCNNGTLSAIACFVLAQNGRRAFILSGGLDGLSATEDHLVTRATRRSDSAERAKVLDVQKISRRLSAVATPGAAAVVPAKKPDVKPSLVVQQQNQVVNELAKLKAKLNNLTANEPARTFTIPKSMPTTDSKPAVASVPDQTRDDSQLWTPIPGSTPQSLNELKISTTPEDSGATSTNHESTKNIELSWINDQVLWDAVVGYRSDPRIDALLAAETHRSTATQPPTPAVTQSQRPVEFGSAPPSRTTRPSLGKQKQTQRTETIRTPKRGSLKWISIAAIIGLITAVAAGLRESPDSLSLPIQLPPGFSNFLTDSPKAGAPATASKPPLNTKPIAAAVNEKLSPKHSTKRPTTVSTPGRPKDPAPAVDPSLNPLEPHPVKSSRDVQNLSAEPLESGNPVPSVSTHPSDTGLDDPLPSETTHRSPVQELQINEDTFQLIDSPEFEPTDSSANTITPDDAAPSSELPNADTSGIAAPELVPEHTPSLNVSSSSPGNSDTNEVNSPSMTHTTTEAEPADVASSPDDPARNTTM